MAKESPAPFRPLQQEITDLPNLITLARIGLIPIILIWIDNDSPLLSAMSALLFAIAAATDALDGYLARRMELVTVVGKFLDPLADKLIVLSTLVMLVAVDRAPAWLVVVLMSRELAITGLRAVASQRGFVIAAGSGGKIKTALQLTGIIFLLIHFRYPILFVDFSLDFHIVGIYVLYVSLIMSVVSAAQYFQFFARAAAEQAEEMAAQGLTRAVVKQRLAERRTRARLRRMRRRAARRLAQGKRPRRKGSARARRGRGRKGRKS